MSERYCICRSTDVTRFMIGCDNCEDWFHGDCVNVTERESKYILKYYCKKCRRANPKLSVEYDRKYKEKMERHKLDRQHDKEKRRETEEERAARKDRERENKKVEKRSSKEARSRSRSRDRKSKKDTKSRSRSRDRKSEKRSRSKDARDKGRDRKRHRSRSGSKERKDKKENNKDRDRAKIKMEPMSDSSDEDIKTVKSAVKHEMDSNFATVKHESADVKPIIKEEPVSKKRRTFDSPEESSDNDDDWEPDELSLIRKPVKPIPPAPKHRVARAAKRRKNRNEFSSNEDQNPTEILDGTNQCFGYKCKNAARVGSKYCSDNCGINLATIRIMKTLPERIREWNSTSCIAEQKNRKELEKIRTQQDEVQSRLKELNVEFENLENLIAQGKSQTIQEDDTEEEVEEASVNCVTCGADVHIRGAIRHMERCYNKMESKTSFASRYKTQIDDARMFCDYYNAKEDTYCKRLQVLCPEHNPDPRILEDEVCGCPLTSGHGFCRLTRKQCQGHFGWEKLRRAELDMERVRQWMKADELLEQERQIKASMASRAGLIGLLLHSTVNHELQERLQQQQYLHRKQPQQNPNTWKRANN